MKALPILLVLLPIVLCFGLGYKFASDERAFEQGAESVQGTVRAIHDRTRFNGSDAEDITTVEVAYTTKDEKTLTAEADVAYAVGLSAGKPVEVLYKKAEPQKIQIRAGFLNRSSEVVFFHLFGAFWLVLGLGIFVVLARARAMAKDPAAHERIALMKESLRKAQEEREKRSP